MAVHQEWEMSDLFLVCVIGSRPLPYPAARITKSIYYSMYVRRHTAKYFYFFKKEGTVTG